MKLFPSSREFFTRIQENPAFFSKVPESVVDLNGINLNLNLKNDDNKSNR